MCPWAGEEEGGPRPCGDSVRSVCSLLEPLWESLGEKMRLLGGQVRPAFVFGSVAGFYSLGLSPQYLKTRVAVVGGGFCQLAGGLKSQR